MRGRAVIQTAAGMPDSLNGRFLVARLARWPISAGRLWEPYVGFCSKLTFGSPRSERQAHFRFLPTLLLSGLRWVQRQTGVSRTHALATHTHMDIIGIVNEKSRDAHESSSAKK
jgi:hypothetical protein